MQRSGEKSAFVKIGKEDTVAFSHLLLGFRLNAGKSESGPGFRMPNESLLLLELGARAGRPFALHPTPVFITRGRGEVNIGGAAVGSRPRPPQLKFLWVVMRWVIIIFLGFRLSLSTAEETRIEAKRTEGRGKEAQRDFWHQFLFGSRGRTVIVVVSVRRQGVSETRLTRNREQRFESSDHSEPAPPNPSALQS
jgi:hypothetical protein